MFEFNNLPNRMTLALMLGPGPVEIRKQIYESLDGHPPLNPTTKSLNQKWNWLWGEELLSNEAYVDGVSLDDLRGAIVERWHTFTSAWFLELKPIVERQLSWIWGTSARLEAEQA